MHPPAKLRLVVLVACRTQPRHSLHRLKAATLLTGRALELPKYAVSPRQQYSCRAQGRQKLYLMPGSKFVKELTAVSPPVNQKHSGKYSDLRMLALIRPPDAGAWSL